METDAPVMRRSRLSPEIMERVRKEIEERWLPDRIPEGWPPFDLEVSDGCSGPGVRQLAQHCCALHDADYWYGRNWADKLVADWRLALCIWKYSRELPPQPWASTIAWWGVGFFRFLGVAIFAWRPFYKPYKRKGWKPSAPAADSDINPKENVSWPH